MPNLFNYATKELSQDAMICWLIAWSEHTNLGCSEQADLAQLGRRFVDALLNHKRSGRAVRLVLVSDVEIFQQEKNIDVLARINGKHVLLIEDKTDTNPHGDQLARYRKLVRCGHTKLGAVSKEDVVPIYFKTGNQPLATERTIEAEDYKVFDRKDFLGILNDYTGSNAIVHDFRRRLQFIEHETLSFWRWRKGDDRSGWKWHGWEGLFREIEERRSSEEPALHSQGWGYVPNPSGGFLGFWWRPGKLPAKSPAYLQLEWEDLCFKVDASELRREEQESLKWEWHAQITQQELVIKPNRMRLGKHMTVGKHADGWLRFGQNDVLDIDATVCALRKADETLLAAARR